MAKVYPQGAISSINELLELPYGTKVFQVSKKHIRTDINGIPSYSKIILTRRIGADVSEIEGEGYRYHWFEFMYASDKNQVKHRTSLLDANVIENGYNDWYLFPKLEDARVHLGLCPHCGK